MIFNSAVEDIAALEKQSLNFSIFLSLIPRTTKQLYCCTAQQRLNNAGEHARGGNTSFLRNPIYLYVLSHSSATLSLQRCYELLTWSPKLAL